MKHWNRRLGVKIACFVLTVPLLVAILLGIVGIRAMWQEGYYFYEKQELQQRELQQLFQQRCWHLMNATTQVDGEIIFHLSSYDEPQRTNLRLRILDWTGKEVCTNVPEGEPLSDTPMVACYAVGVEDGFYWSDYLGRDPQDLKEGQYAVYGWVVSDLTVWDDYRWNLTVLETAWTLRYAIYGIVAACMLLFAFCFANLTATAGRQPGSQELHPGRLDSIPTDVLLLGCVCIVAVWFPILDKLTWGMSGLFGNLLIWLSIVAGAYCSLGLWLCLAGRFKRKQLLKNSLIYKVCSFLWRTGKTLVQSLPMIWKTGLLALGLFLWNFFMFAFYNSGRFLCALMFFAEAAVITFGLLWSAIQLRKLQKAGQALAEGNLSHKLDTSGMVGDLKAHGENLNSIAQGMGLAVREQIKSQRLRTELITNVSHDIKNPLTSIINYAELITQEPCDNEKHLEYAQVLGRKSEHLKRLLEDLVEVSKAATGNMDVDLAPCQAEVLLEQLAGEFQDRCRSADLTLVVRQPEEPVRILVDSRRIWRVFENLMGNACKYSLPGSRVYLSLEKRGDTAVFTFRNTSREPLDISPEELIERFVRGDSARSTEGNGLGLSIAQSLTQVQGGEMNLGIDGDLFKVTLAFPIV